MNRKESGGDAAADVPLGFVDFQHFFDLGVQRVVEFWQPLAQILVNSGFADAEFFGCGADRRPVLYNVLSERDGTLLDIPFQKTTLPAL